MYSDKDQSNSSEDMRICQLAIPVLPQHEDAYDGNYDA
jgi:hypothetical protein